MLHRDGTLHFSDLKKFGLSPAHYLASVRAPDESTLAMRIGTIVHRTVLGGPLLVYPGERRGKAWETFRDSHDDEIVTQAEVDRALPIAEAVLANPVAAPYLKGRHEVPLKWEMLGIPCSTRGVDVIGDGGFIVDLKTSKTTEPGRFGRLSLWAHYHAQLAFYLEACAANGIVAREAFIVGVESTPPYAVTVMRVTPRALEQGRACIRLWLEQLASCRAAGAWPAYVQSVVDLDVDNEVQLVGLQDEEDAP